MNFFSRWSNLSFIIQFSEQQQMKPLVFFLVLGKVPPKHINIKGAKANKIEKAINKSDNISETVWRMISHETNSQPN